MEPWEWGLTAIAAAIVKKVLKTTSETLTKETLAAILPRIESVVANLPQRLQLSVRELGDRLQKRLPEAENPFDDLVLLANLVEEEVKDPQMAAAVEEVRSQLPPIEIRIDKRDRSKQQGIILEGNAWSEH